MSDENKASDKDVLADISKSHADQPGDLGRTRTEKTDQADAEDEHPTR
ncbi:hypothetical protein NFI95_10315 [Acetobacteraceae bacterium KSS8]|uniref:Uncharacterized protein n=1 Tax=Endosaccharibacter trunci TaxID=2812733 RepID=A0ABT1W7J3_9PROT|nr:hypothetical protein [Acetobacteraceae bacterium KSS8]